MMVVVPPWSAARPTTSGGSVSPTVPSGLGNGQAQCTCGSMPPGMTILPVASISRTPSGSGNVPGAATATMRSPFNGDVAGRHTLRRDDRIPANQHIDHQASSKTSFATLAAVMAAGQPA